MWSARQGRRDRWSAGRGQWDPPSSPVGRSGGGALLTWPRPCRCAACADPAGRRVQGHAPAEAPSADMEEAPLLGGMSSPEDEIVPDLFSAESRFVSENIQLKGPMVVKAEEDEFHVFPDAYLSPADPKEPLLHAFNPPLNVDCKNKVKVELLVDENEEEILGEYPSLPELNPLEDAVLPAAPPPPPPAYNVHFLSSLLPPHRSPAVVPLGTWAREGAAHPGVRMIPVRSAWDRQSTPSPLPYRDVRLLAYPRISLQEWFS